MINWISVSSSNLDALAFDQGDLYIRFKSGSIYYYSDVPISLYLDILGAGSKGKFHHANLKNKFNYKRIA